jgi:hypothetical protein
VQRPEFKPPYHKKEKKRNILPIPVGKNLGPIFANKS